MSNKTYLGSPPAVCDICHARITKVFVDGKINVGPWANMCMNCHKSHGAGLGIGLGQQYEKQADGSWKKTAG